MSASLTNQRLRTLQEASERISANLVDLELDSARQLLEASTLRGESAARWAEASATMTELWRRHGLLQDVLARAEKTRGDGRQSLLEGPSIELGRADAPLASRSLLQSPESTERCTPADLLRSMSDAFDEVTAVLAAIASAWDRLTPRVEEARRLLRASTDLADELGGAPRTDVEAAAAALTRVSAAVTGDPLSVTDSDVEDVLRTIRQIHAEVEAGTSLKHEFEARMLDAHQLLDRVRGAIRCAHTARDELRVKIATPAVPASPGSPDRVERALGRISDLAAAGAWSQAQTELAEWTEEAHALLHDANTSVAASRAPIEARNQFRALLDAYQVKAARLGLVEEPELADLFGRAYDVLHVAPTDLAAGAQLVRSYQQAVSGWPNPPTARP